MQKLERYWYSPQLNVLTGALLPISWVFAGLVSLRRFFYRHQFKKIFRAPVPVIVVGNITVGGTGKTPLIIWLANFLKSQGYRPGIVSRGCGGKQQKTARIVDINSDPASVGDEAVLIAKQSGCPMVVGVGRGNAVKQLLAHADCNVILSDDGLQHYALCRDIEIAVMDSERGLGNQQFLPAGPLRESPKRLQEVDFVISHGKSTHFQFNMQLHGDEVVSLKDETLRKSLLEFRNQSVHVLAGIGNPQRFFSSLDPYLLCKQESIFPDHFLFKKEHIYFNDNFPVIMTEKDAVKCKSFADERHWYVPVKASIDARFGDALLTKLQGIILCKQK